uniref:G domain-containing protein n=1 Tax=Panagrolaimus sp. PS1159 TaxID=55785 RepID=A0AC35G2L4_9BILA
MSDTSRRSSFEILSDDSFQQSDKDDQPSSDQEPINNEMLNEKLAENFNEETLDEAVSMGFLDTCEQSVQDVEDSKNLDQKLRKSIDQNCDKMAPPETKSSGNIKINQNEPKIRHSFARLCQQQNPSTALIYKNMQKTESLYLNIPCPKCNEADCFWYCQKCDTKFRCQNRTIFCKCCQGSLLDFEFCCIKKCHDNQFYRYQNIKASAVLERLTLKKSVNILLLGSTGVGKTTLVNSIANYLKYETLEEAERNPLSLLVPTSFQIYHELHGETDVKIGNENEFERFARGESATRCPKVHTIAYNNVVMNFIDTPGLCDTSGINKDKEHLNQILNFICSFPELHGICIMLKSGESRKNVELEYCINQLLLHFHKTSIKNLMFCFTRSRGKVAQDTPTTIGVLLKEINQKNGTELVLKRDISYSVDNEAFRYLCAKKKGFLYDEADDNYCHVAWERSRNETFRLINHVLSNSPHLTNETVVLNAVRSIIIGLNKPLATITTQIQKNKHVLDIQRKDIENLTGKEKDFKTRIKISQISVKKVPLDRWITVCNKCAKAKRDDHQHDYKVYPKLCCGKCRAPLLYFCSEFYFWGKCRKCQCPISHHEHINYEYVENTNIIEDAAVKKELLTVSSEIEAKKRVIEWIGTILEEYDNEQKLVNRCAAVFSSYLKSNSIIMNNKSHEEYLNIELENAKLAGKIADIQNLENALQNYYDEKEILEKQLSQSNTGASSNELTAEDIFKARNELFNLKWCGTTLQHIFDRELTNPVFQHVNLIQQQLTQKQLCKKDVSSWRKRTREICETIMSGMNDYTSTNFTGSPRIDDYGRSLYKGPLKNYAH